MKLNDQGLAQKDAWAKAGIEIPSYDRKAMADATCQEPRWIHFGAGNIFRGFIAGLQHELLEKKKDSRGILAVDTFDFQLIEEIYTKYDSLTLNVALHPDGTMEKKVIASVAKGLRGSHHYPQDFQELEDAFLCPGLEMVSFTVTEKGYALQDMEGNFFPFVQAEFEAGTEQCQHVMCLVTALLWKRFQKNACPLAMVSMDNCSHNGEKLKQAVVLVATEWQKRGFVSQDFLPWLTDETKVSFPWSMIDKITPRPASAVAEALKQGGVEDMEPIITNKNTFIAPFVNAEVPQYLVIEDNFPNGRPALEEAGVYFTDRTRVNQTETMKVTTCLNPLHTALAVFGCLLGYETIAEEMKHPKLQALVEGIGYQEGLPVVVDPKIISPKEFLDEVVSQRLPNPFLPDTPQRIATDTSQKVGIRFGETIKAYGTHPSLSLDSLRCIPLAIAGWLRYLMGVDDKGAPMVCSADPMLETLQAQLSTVKLGDSGDFSQTLNPILSNALLFGVDLVEVGLADRISALFGAMVAEAGAVERTLEEFA